MHKTIEKINQFDQSHPYVTSIGRGALRFAAGKVIQRVGDKIGVPLRHGRADDPGREEIFSKHPALSVIGMTTLVPAGEELVWRHMPTKLSEHLSDNPKTQEAIQMGMMSLFMAQHMGKDGIPIQHLGSAANLQNIYNRHGYVAATLAHVTNNTLAVADYAYKKHRTKHSN